jgi:aminomethyltransferase
MFDVSHMGELLVSGAMARDFLQYCLSNDISQLEDGEGQYTLLMNSQGGVNDDLIVYRLSANEYLLVVNAANSDEDYSYLTELANLDLYEGEVSVTDESSAWSMIAVQGPTSLDLVQAALGIDLRQVSPFRIVRSETDDCPILAATTGYTGESGCELLIPPQSVEHAWQVLLDAGVMPCGLGARDTLRLEVCYPLHGNEIDSERNPISAKLGWVCALGTGFIGEQHVARCKAEGAEQLLTPVKATERGVLRPGMIIKDHEGREVGRLTSGTLSPTLNVGIGLGYVDRDQCATGTRLLADVRGRDLPIEVVASPFVRGGIAKS